MSREKPVVRKIRTRSKDNVLVEERRMHIVRSATRLFVRNGYQNTNMRQIAEACGMSYGSAYHYIGSKKDVLYLIVNFAITSGVQRVESIRERISGLNPEESLREAIKAYLEHVEDLQDMFNVINHAMVNLSGAERIMVFEAEDRVMAFFEEVIRSGIETGVFVTSDSFMAASSIVILAQAWAHRRWFLRKRYSLAEYADELAKLMLGRLAVDEGP